MTAIPPEWRAPGREGARPSFGAVMQTCRKLRDRGPQGVTALRDLVASADYIDLARAVAGKVLAASNTAETAHALARLVGDASDPWARLAAAEALAAVQPDQTVIDALANALGDEHILYSMWAGFRVSDAAALSLHRLGTDAARLQPWRQRRTAQLASDDDTTRAMAAYALAPLGDARALAALHDLVSQDDWQAQELLDELTA